MFIDLARNLLKGRREDSLPVVEIAHPVGGISAAQACARITDNVVGQVASSLTGEGASLSSKPNDRDSFVQTGSAGMDIEGTEVELAEEFYQRGWTDGLPIIVPTKERVNAILQSVPMDPLETIGCLLPRNVPVTLHDIGVNAVMAGCRPEYMPVIITAIEAVQEPDFNLYGVQTTTHNCGIMVIVHGPISQAISMNSGHNCMGNGNRANAAIGRAVRLILQNVGGATPGELDKATLGSPAKFTYCFAENEGKSPWPPFRTALGFAESDSCITVVAAEAPHNINDHGSTTASSVLNTIAQTMATVGSNNMYVGGDTYVIIGPEHAKTIADGGFSRTDVQKYLYEHARVPIARISREKMEELSSWGGYKDRLEEWKEGIPLVRIPEDMRVIVAGGSGKHSAWCPTFGATRSVTRRIENI
jgi:hypothetical protein